MTDDLAARVHDALTGRHRTDMLTTDLAAVLDIGEEELIDALSEQHALDEAPGSDLTSLDGDREGPGYLLADVHIALEVRGACPRCDQRVHPQEPSQDYQRLLRHYRAARRLHAGLRRETAAADQELGEPALPADIAAAMHEMGFTRGVARRAAELLTDRFRIHDPDYRNEDEGVDFAV